MGHIYRELQEIPIPEGARINHYNGEVSVYSYPNGVRSREVIGSAVGETKMHPNTNFKHRYPELWAKYYGEKNPHANFVHVGLYALTLGIVEKTGLYQALEESLGTGQANAVMDYAMFGIRTQADSDKRRDTPPYDREMDEQMLFCNKCHSEAWYADFFAGRIPQDGITEFKRRWIERCVEQGVRRVWLCMDSIPLAGEDGEEDPSGGAAYFWALDARTGRPVTWWEAGPVRDPGTGMLVPDDERVDEVRRMLIGAGMTIEGVIVSEPFVDRGILTRILAKNLRYLVKLPRESRACCELVERHGKNIMWNSDYLLSADTVFGLADRARLFDDSTQESPAALYFIGGITASEARGLIRRVFHCIERFNESLEGGEEYSIPEDLEKYLILDRKDPDDPESPVVCARLNPIEMDHFVMGRNFFSIASSGGIEAAEMLALVHKRNLTGSYFDWCRRLIRRDPVCRTSPRAVESACAQASRPASCSWTSNSPAAGST